MADKLHEGANCIAVLVHVYGVDTAWYEKTKGMWVPTFGDGGLWVDGAAVFPGRSGAGQERVSLSTDTDWNCIESEAWDRDTERMNSGLLESSSLMSAKCRMAGNLPASMTPAGTGRRSFTSVPEGQEPSSAAS